MLVLDRREHLFPDDVDPRRAYRLPQRLVPLPGPDGVPQALLTRTDGGGQLMLRLGGEWQLGDNERPVTFRGGRFRLRLRTPTGDTDAGAWHETAIVGPHLVDRCIALDAGEAAIARRLAIQGDDVVEIEAMLDVEGLRPAYPWLVRLDTAAILPRIEALLPAQPTTWEEVENAFLGLSVDAFKWYPVEPAALMPGNEAALSAIARSAGPILFHVTDNGWTLAADPAGEHLDLNLAVTGVDKLSIPFSWSFSEFLNTAAEPARHVIDVTVPSPFEAADMHVVNDVPLAPAGVRSIAVEVTTGGPTGRVKHEFLPGQPSAARLRFVRETFDDVSLRWRAHVTVQTGSGPQVVSTDFRPADMMLQITSAALGLSPLRFAAGPQVFEHVAALTIGLANRTLHLRPESPEAWAVGRTPPATVSVTAVLPGGAQVDLGQMPLDQRGLVVSVDHLGVGEAGVMTLRAPADLDRRAAYLALQVDDGSWRTVEPGGEVSWAVTRANRLLPMSTRYRLRHVPRGADGATEPMRDSTWVEAVGDVVELDI